MKTKEFISRFNEVEVIQRMASVKTPEEAYAVATEYGVTDSLEEFVEEMTRFKAAIDELSEEDLEAVAGGLNQYDTMLAVSVASAVTATAALTTAEVATVLVTTVSLSATASAVVSASAMSAVAMAAASSV